jgi:hypothetical protein
MFKSFFLAGFASAIGHAATGDRLAHAGATGDDRQVDADYARLRDIGIRACREAISWPTVDRKGHYDFSPVVPFLDAARAHGIEVVWDLFHDGYPPDLDPFQAAFIHRFASYSAAAARFVEARTVGTCWFAPIVEPSFLAWAGGEEGHVPPRRRGEGRDLKAQLARAAIAGINAIRSVCPRARIVNVDPLCRVVPPIGGHDAASACDGFNDGAVFEFWDILGGRLMPELGGSREHLDVVGITSSSANQWELGREGIPLAGDDPRRMPLRHSVRRVWERYGGDLLIAATGDVRDTRAAWLAEIERECAALLADGIPLRGVCLSPILGMPDRNAREHWTRMGLWDVGENASDRLRTVCQPVLDALRSAQRLERAFQAGSWR